ncbi:unnamed protein product [Acanthoscelides obtectus]|uniref:Uncharacterized protein n=1 Tax=Acanthoscelides obtectus TaxID=200917 RepID=A0A9P0LHB5_ACAOB|nr:unnamed protein product [Acanthoscelides obtectus]CAK1675649.1 hypothetical protein AOBTE_LOCUS30341 [Acanthoscelides obtectus]
MPKTGTLPQDNL